MQVAFQNGIAFAVPAQRAVRTESFIVPGENAVPAQRIVEVVRECLLDQPVFAVDVGNHEGSPHHRRASVSLATIVGQASRLPVVLSIVGQASRLPVVLRRPRLWHRRTGKRDAYPTFREGKRDAYYVPQGASETLTLRSAWEREGSAGVEPSVAFSEKRYFCSNL